jgi:hypothetical protein
MIYTIGFDSIPNTKPICLHTKMNLTIEDVILINCCGARREVWEREHYFSPSFKLAGVLPTPLQALMIRDFLLTGGTVITTIEDPFKAIKTTAYKDEVKEVDDILITSGDGCTIEFEYYPYNWLIDPLSQIPYQIYERVRRHSKHEDQNQMTRTKISDLLLKVGDYNGHLIFTSSIQRWDAQYILNFLNLTRSKTESKEVEYSVIKR